MLNKYKKWFHSSRVKLPFVNMSANWFLCQCIDLGIGSKLILSNNQSSVGSGNMSHCRASSFNDHLDHCFVAIKDIQRSFLTKWKHGWRKKSTLSRSIVPWSFFRFWRLWSAARTVSRFVHQSPRAWFPWVVFPWRTATIKSHKSSAGIPSNDFGFFWTVWHRSFFLAHPTEWNKRMTSKHAHCTTWSRFVSPQDLLQNQSLETVPICIVWQCYPHANVCNHMNEKRKRSNDNRLSQTFVHFVIDANSLNKDYQVLPQLPKTFVETIWQHSCDNSPSYFISSSLKWGSSMHGVDTLQTCWIGLFANSQYRSTRFFAWTSTS